MTSPVKFACENQDWRDEARKKLISFGLYNPNRVGDPTCDIGTALYLANDCGIELYGGICYQTARAVFPKEKWAKHPPEKCGYENSIWVDRLDICEAVCQCVIQCREWGLL